MPNAKCVLVVDDDTAIRMLVADALDAEGYDVVTAIHGADALVKLATVQPDAIVLDLMMPVMTGWEFLDTCGDELVAAGIPVAVVSAAYAPGAIASRPAVSAVLSKPFDLDVLEAIVRQLTSRRGPAGEPS
jgi:two-component system chemotaxis response regulator CheY